jgi:hypothetical protein
MEETENHHTGYSQPADRCWMMGKPEVTVANRPLHALTLWVGFERNGDVTTTVWHKIGGHSDSHASCNEYDNGLGTLPLGNRCVCGLRRHGRAHGGVACHLLQVGTLVEGGMLRAVAGS